MKKHPFDPWSFMFGLFLAVVGLVLLVPATPLVRPQAISALIGIGGPVLVILVGLSFMAPLFRRKPLSIEDLSQPPPPLTDELPPSPLDSL